MFSSGDTPIDTRYSFFTRFGLAQKKGGGGVGLCLRSSFTLVKPLGATYHGTALATEWHFPIASVRCAQKPDFNRPALCRHLPSYPMLHGCYSSNPLIVQWI